MPVPVPSEETPAAADPPRRLSPAWTRALLVVGVLALLAAAASSNALHGLLVRLLKESGPIIAEYPVSGATIFIALSALSALLAFFSAAVIVPVAVYTWGEPLTLLFLWIGWMLGGMGAYGVGYGLGRPIVRLLVSGDALTRFESRISRDLPFGLVLLFQLAAPSEVPGYVLGLVRYPFPRFLLALAIAELPYAMVTVYLGSSFLEQRVSSLLFFGAGAAVFSVLALRLLGKRLSA